MHKLSGRLILLFLVLVLLNAACGGGSSEVANSDQAAISKVFSYRGEDAAQVLQVKWLSDTVINFVLEHRQDDCHYTITGDALNPYRTQDPESDVDPETGEVYWVDLYLYSRTNCRMAIRIAQDTSRAQLQLVSCAASPSCAIESVGLLRRAE